LITVLLVIVPTGYLFGSIPFGLLIGLVRGVDIRRHGSGNIGATNAGRLLGRKFFFIALILDLLKGLIPTAAAGWVLKTTGAFADQGSLACAAWLAVGFAAVAGHNWSCWLRFKGGKGVATSLGMVLAIYPYYTYPGLIALAVWVLVVLVTGYVSLGSIFAAIGFITALGVLFGLHGAWRLGVHWPLLAFAVFMAVMLIVRHRGNIRRLRNGTESKFFRSDTSEKAL